jgi:drug/metabolite transporter (DMT)-like permease
LSGALLLALLAARLAPATGGRPRDRDRDWLAVVALSAYLICFTYAYHSLAAGAGALLLFGAVQLTMFATALRAGERLTAAAWLGVALAIGGLCYLVAPGLAAPDPAGAALMAAAGVAWGTYSLRGRRNASPLRATAANFIGAVPIVALAGLLLAPGHHLAPEGVLLAVASGAVTSGLGYVVWYAALPHLSSTSAATVQLSVPVITAVGGVVLLAEPLTLRLLLAGTATLGGVALVIGRRRGA